MTPKDLCTRLEAMAIRLDLDGDAECYLLQEAADLISTQDHAYVGSTQEIWDAINVDLQQIVDDVSCWQGQHTERVCENLSEVIARLNAAVSHERAGYESAIAAGYAADKAAEERDALKQELEALKAQKPAKLVWDFDPATGQSVQIPLYRAAGAGGPL